MTFGGYPAVVLAPSIAEKKELLSEIGLSYIKKDITEAHIMHQEKYYFLLKILANQVGNLLNVHELANTINIASSTVEHYIYIMKKSFHIATISPFHKNIRKELTKMPKVHFYDMGLRNYFLNNFEGFDMRIDKGSLFENAVYRRLIDTYPTHAIKFWRTQNKNEIDFILEDHKKAYEVKIHTKNFIASKYKLFQQHYPDFDLQVIGRDNVFLV